MAEFTFNYDTKTFKSNIDIIKFTKELVLAGFIVYNVNCSNDNKTCIVIVDKDDKSTIDTVVSNHDGPDSLNAHKDIKFESIDRRTNELIRDGFQYAGKTFNLDYDIQLITSICQIRDDSAIKYPIRWNTKNNYDYYDIIDSADFYTFYVASITKYKEHIDSGTTLKNQVRDATSISEVDAIIDNR